MAWAAVRFVVIDFLFIVTPIVGLVCCTLLYVHSSFAIILIGMRELVALLSLSSWGLRDGCVALPRGAMCLSAVVIVVFPDHTHCLSVD